MPVESRYQRLVDLMGVFVSGRDRSRRQVRAIEEAFAEQLDEDERFEDLQYALAMFGADGYDIEDQLVKECAWALKTLQSICVYAECQAAIVPGTRFCSLHQPG